MEKTKRCKSCDTVKQLTAFTKGKAVCKACRTNNQNNLNKRKRLEQKKMELCSDKYFTKRVNAFAKYLILNGENDLSYISSQLQDITTIYEKMVDQMSVMYFPIKISENLQNYLDQLDDLYDPNPSTAMEILMRTPEPIFIETFGISNIKLSEQIEDELDDLKYIIHAISHANNVLIDEHNKKISNGISGKDRFEYIEADIALDISIPAITFNNLFNMQRECMLDKIKTIQDSGNIWVKAFVKNGYFDKFWKILDLSED